MLRIGGFTPLSATDWPGMLSAVVFCQGCSWRCRYCHNPGLIPTQGEDEIRWEAVLEFLQRRRGLLDGVVFSGGEPTLQSALADAMREVRELGFKVGLHTAGIYPQRLEGVLPLVDWIGLDVKAPFADYARITGVPESGERARASLDLVLQSGVDHEIRTTVHPALLADEQVMAIAHDLAGRRVGCYVLQAFRREGCNEASLTQDWQRARPISDLAREVSNILSRSADTTTATCRQVCR
jgi:pyruvate formate lyase activating enzyme